MQYIITSRLLHDFLYVSQWLKQFELLFISYCLFVLGIIISLWKFYVEQFGVIPYFSAGRWITYNTALLREGYTCIRHNTRILESLQNSIEFASLKSSKVFDFEYLTFISGLGRFRTDKSRSIFFWEFLKDTHSHRKSIKDK